MRDKPKFLVSLCLLGVDCRWDGGNNRCAALGDLLDRFELIPVCPEQLGGLATPRGPSERLCDRVVNKRGEDVTEAFERGARGACFLAERFGIKYALLKQRSPSCGSRVIYDGSFSGTKIPGMGVTAEALTHMGVRVYGEDDIERMLNDMESDNI